MCNKRCYLHSMTSIRFIILLLLFDTVTTLISAVIIQETMDDLPDTVQPSSTTSPSYDETFEPEKFNYRCLNTDESAREDSLRIGLQITEDPLHQIMTRIFAIFVQNVLTYENVELTNFDVYGNKFGQEDQFHMLEDMTSFFVEYKVTMINVGVRMPPGLYIKVPAHIYEVGSSMPSGRFGWFVPEYQIDRTILEGGAKFGDSFDGLHNSAYLNPLNPFYQQSIIDHDILKSLLENNGAEMHVSAMCKHQHQCVTLIAEYKLDSNFIIEHINETSSFLNVLWLGPNFREKLAWLHNLYQNDSRYKDKRFIVLHWTPSDVIDGTFKYRSIVMPRCEQLDSLMNSFCKYELTPVLKYFYKKASNERYLLHALHNFRLESQDLHNLIMLQQSYMPHNVTNLQMSIGDVYNKVACDWLLHNKDSYMSWMRPDIKEQIRIGGIFPINDTSRGHQNLVSVIDSAVEAVKKDSTTLSNYEFIVPKNDGQCKPDEVLKSFIHFFFIENVLGILGPACSETVEPIAGISKHTNMTVISYSAEGASFVDRKKYPYFFRTIGSNWQYVDAYITLMQRLNWRRVAALTEDGQKYTEYLSHMETVMKEQDLELIANKKFLAEVSPEEMNKILRDLKQRHAKIIIADIHNRNAEVALCEAYKLEMTAYEGYVWFLPAWLSKNFTSVHQLAYNYSCTSEQMKRAFEGHFTIMHTPFGSPKSIMQENRTIEDWLIKNNSSGISNYAGFAYDAVWTYALAADKLLREYSEAVNNLRSETVTKRLAEIIWETDFEGLSGRVRFGQGGSRITDLDIKQWRQTGFVQVGQFKPKIVGIRSAMHTEGGDLILDSNTIEWLSATKPPGDGTYDCTFAALAKTLNTDCDSAVVVFTTILCVLAVVTVSLISFFFWKQRYDSKLERSAKIMKTFGIDLLSPSRNKNNTLDKWEIPKENVVINRRLGEGAFGTVYGGEAQLTSECWTAVAVKTLKAGASSEDRLDFLSEADAMKRFQHKNIVKLLGVCLQSEPIYTIMEFMLYGDLKTYLLARRHLVNDKTTDDSDISPKRLTMYALDVARGLSYLAQQKYVHRDLACRNCLVNAQRVVKLGDFGMARPTFNSDYYRFNRKGMLPVRWMAPESLALGMFTPASDVWAFGVVIYEVITFGSFPYQGLTNNQVLEFVKSGKKLQIPNGVKPQLEGLLNACWSQDVKKRPTATDLVDYISNYQRLLTPCLDFPSASVAMAETESDEMELLPKLRKCSPQTDTTLDLDIVSQASLQNNFERSNQLIQDMPPTQPVENLYVNPMNIETFSAVTPDGYSVMSPLLMHQISETSNSSQARLLPSAPAERQEQTPF
ncbi:receptor-type guanylate cyclase gcy-13-like [Teleopsis dalmanni]|uniref:receptor-type guanylate cyclase gcy-13-like n=1 Tax=Teleopsis dalmanni TaxID=139649 RepID=UPI000D32A697|nr:receptor-type guanylate cyclase gcy-13-like [Teleopsis dalmanni]